MSFVVQPLAHDLVVTDRGFALRLRCLGHGGLVTPRRGNVTSFSLSSSRRLRDWLLTHRGPGSPLAVTLTLRYVASPDRWRRACNAFATRITRYGGCYVWRVELQRRGTPHLHAVVWGVDDAIIRHAWLSVWGLSADPDHLAHAVHAEPISADGSRWYAYLAQHASKHKAPQLGWLGRQWGVVNRRSFDLVSSCRYSLPVAIQHVIRVYNRYLALYCPGVCPLRGSGGIRFVDSRLSDVFLEFCRRHNCFEEGAGAPFDGAGPPWPVRSRGRQSVPRTRG